MKCPSEWVGWWPSLLQRYQESHNRALYLQSQFHHHLYQVCIVTQSPGKIFPCMYQKHLQNLKNVESNTPNLSNWHFPKKKGEKRRELFFICHPPPSYYFLTMLLSFGQNASSPAFLIVTTFHFWFQRRSQSKLLGSFQRDWWKTFFALFLSEVSTQKTSLSREIKVFLQ